MDSAACFCATQRDKLKAVLFKEKLHLSVLFTLHGCVVAPGTATAARQTE